MDMEHGLKDFTVLSADLEDNNQTNVFSLVWLGISPNESPIDCNIQKVQDELRSNFDKNLKIFDDDFDCEYYIRDLPLFTKILFIVDDISAQIMVERASYISQVVCTFVYGKQDPNDQLLWAKSKCFRMVKFITIDQLVPCIKGFEARWLLYSSSAVLSAVNNECNRSTTRVNGLYIFSQHIIDILLELKPLASEFQLFIRGCAEIFADKPDKLKQLRDLRMCYKKENAVFCYTKNNFMHTFINEALRMENIERLYLCRFFIRDIRTQLSEHQYPSSIRVYRGQQMARSELEDLQRMVNQLVVVKSILSTSISREVAKTFINLSPSEKEGEPVLFEIDADPRLNENEKKPFANIIELSNFDTEKEVLFMFGSIFLLTDVCLEDGIWILKMSLWESDETELQPVLDILGNNQTNFKDNKSSLDFICLVSGLDLDDLAIKLTKQYLVELTWEPAANPDHPIEIAKCYHRLGFINLKQSHYESALEWLNKALEMFATALPTTHLFTAATHISIGDTFSSKGDMKQARVAYQIALNIYERDYSITHPKTKACRDNIVWHTSRKENSFRRPIDFWQSLVELKEDYLSTIESQQFVNALSQEQTVALESLPVEDMLKQLQLVLNSNTVGQSRSTRGHLKLHPLANAMVANRHPFSFITGIVTYRCPCCKEPVWVYRVFSMFKGSPCFRCIGKILTFKQK